MFGWIKRQFRKPEIAHFTPIMEGELLSVPRLASHVVVVVENRVVGWVDPRIEARMGAITLEQMLISIYDALSEGRPNPFHENHPLPNGWESEEGIEAGFRYYRHTPASGEENVYFAAMSSSKGGLCIGWNLTVTPEGDVVAVPNEIQHATIVGGEVGTRPHTFAFSSHFTDWPSPVPIGNLGRFIQISEEEREEAGLVISVSDGYSFTNDYTGPFWKPEKEA